MTKPVQTYCAAVKFTIQVCWPDADVDAVYCELGGMFQEHTTTNHRTPIAASVDRFLDAVFADPELKARGLDAKTADNFMMGCCAMEFELDPDRIAELPQMIEFATKRMRQLRQQHVRYYKQGRHLTGGAVHVVTR
jgi:hypothetical protein